MKKNVIIYLPIAFAASIWLLPVIALAQNQSNYNGINLDANSLLNILNNIKVWFAEAIFILGIVVILYAAFLYMTAGGDEEKINRAKKAFVYGIVGIIVAMLAYGIWTSVYSFLNTGSGG